MTVWHLERALDDGLVGKALRLAAVEERLAFYEGSRRAGIPALRSLIGGRREDGWVPPSSELEARLYAVLERLAGCRPSSVRPRGHGAQRRMERSTPTYRSTDSSSRATGDGGTPGWPTLTAIGGGTTKPPPTVCGWCG